MEIISSFFSTKKLVGHFQNSSFSKLNSFSLHLVYLISVSLVGFVSLKFLNPSIKGLDLFFTSVSADTVSSMSAIEMEVFSNHQLLIITILMLVGGEVFTSIIGLCFMKSKLSRNDRIENLVELSESPTLEIPLSQIESGLVNPETDSQKLDISLDLGTMSLGNDDLTCKSRKCLLRVVLCYYLAIHIFGSILVYIYISLISNTTEVLNQKGLEIQTFSVFLTVSTFSNCGFTPTNENMTIFSKNSGLLLLLVPQILLGNSFFAPCLHFLLWLLKKFTKRKEFGYLLSNHSQVGYDHLLSKLHCLCVVATSLGFILVQFIIFCLLEWNSELSKGLNSYEKLVGSLFQIVNSRHAGESVFDISMVSPAILVMFVVMMYLPAYTSVCPIGGFTKDSTNWTKDAKQSNNLVDYILFSNLSYIVIFIALVCVTEKDKMKSDPLNFNVLNITLEVVSAYGNVGFQPVIAVRGVCNTIADAEMRRMD